MFKRVALASALFAFQLSLAIGAELDQPPLKAPPIVYDWAGFYLGMHGGYGWGHDPFDISVTGTLGGSVPLSNIESRGLIYGLHAGYNWEYKSFVFGFETDFDATSIRGSTSNASNFSNIFGAPSTLTDTASLQDHFNYLASLRTRIGYLIFPQTLLYATGGPSWARVTQFSSNSGVEVLPQNPLGTQFESVTTTNSTISDRFGFVVGAGSETRFSMFSLPLLLRLEYLHYDFGAQNSSSFSDTICNANAPCGTFNSANTSGHLTTDIVRGGISIQFK